MADVDTAFKCGYEVMRGEACEVLDEQIDALKDFMQALKAKHENPGRKQGIALVDAALMEGLRSGLCRLKDARNGIAGGQAINGRTYSTNAQEQANG